MDDNTFEECNAPGAVVDTAAGEVIRDGEVIRQAQPGAALLMLDADGTLSCDGCAVVEQCSQ